MRKTLSIIALIAFFFSLCACAEEEPTVFYYPRKDPQDYVYGAADAVIAAETREVADDADLTYLLKLYLEGPLSPELKSPFPEGTGLTGLSITSGKLEIQLSEPFTQLDGIRHSVACACIASTCFALTNVKEVSIGVSAPGDHEIITLFRDSVTLVDDSAIVAPTQ